jgi:hypothetical protein
MQKLLRSSLLVTAAVRVRKLAENAVLLLHSA